MKAEGVATKQSSRRRRKHRSLRVLPCHVLSKLRSVLLQFCKQSFDGTLGFPGEGPAVAKGLALPTVLTINSNSGNSLLDFLDKARPDDHVILAQEIKIPNEVRNGENLIDVFVGKVRAKGYRIAISPCIRTKAGGLSAGVAVLFKPFLNAICEWTVLESRAISVMFRLKGMGDFVFTSVYGYCSEGSTGTSNRQLWERLANDSAKVGKPFMWGGGGGGGFLKIIF
jgi:hypothetical protein